MRIFVIASALLLIVSGAQAQVGSGSNNGNGNVGTANGNGNGNGSGNTLSARANTRTTAVVAPSLAAAGIESCLGSTSVGGAGGGVGITIASTVTDRGCNLRLFSRTLYNLGHRKAATQILCAGAAVRRRALRDRRRRGDGAAGGQSRDGRNAARGRDRPESLGRRQGPLHELCPVPRLPRRAAAGGDGGNRAAAGNAPACRTLAPQASDEAAIAERLKGCRERAVVIPDAA